MKLLMLATVYILTFACSHEHSKREEDDIQREEEIQREEDNRTTISDEIGPAFEDNGRLNSPRPVN